MSKFKKTLNILKKMDPNTELVGIKEEKKQENKFKKGEYYNKKFKKDKK
jgi:hypothetical protein